jgi:small subunit ribosomal protein S7
MKNRVKFVLPPNLEDFKFSSSKRLILRRLIGNIVKRGKKQLAEKIFFESLSILKTRFASVELDDLFQSVFAKVRPNLGVRPKKMGGIVYKLPVILKDAKQNTFMVKWIVQGAQARSGSLSFSSRLADEIADIYSGKPTFAVKKRVELERLALSNRAFLRG